MEKCANCEGPIGKFDTPFIFKDEVVCWRCYERLGPKASPVQPTTPPLMRITTTAVHSDEIRRITDAVFFRLLVLWAVIAIAIGLVLAVVEFLNNYTRGR